jgi:tetratricopeptide (TPR) repeat protein
MYTDSGKAYFRLHRYRESENMLSAALQVAEQFGPQDPRLAVSLNNMARLRQAQKRYGDAEALYNRALLISETERGHEHLDTAVCLSNLAGLLQVEEKHADAEASYKEALAIMEKVLGPEHAGVGRILANYAALLKKINRTAEAGAAEARAKAIRDKAGS